MENNDLILVSGESGTGKSMTLRNIRDQENWMYLNCETKKLPFRNKFKSYTITDPYQVHQGLDYAANSDVKGVIIDTLTFLMDMFETKYIIGSSNTMNAWSNYSQFFKIMMQQKIANLNKPCILLAHTKPVYDDKSLCTRISVPIKGSLANQGIEAYFSCIVSTKVLPVTELTQKNSLLNITDSEQELGFKHVMQTRLTKNTTGERIRSPEFPPLFDYTETFIDNDIQLVLDRLKDYYA